MYCGLRLLVSSHYLTQGDGDSGEGPDAAKAEGRRVRCEREGAFVRTALVSWAEGGDPPQPASQKVPRTPGQVPERQGRRLESHYWSVHHHYAAGEGHGRGWGVCGSQAKGGKMWVWDLLWFPSLAVLWLFGAGNSDCV